VRSLLFVEKWQAILGRKIHKYGYDEAVRGFGLLPSFLMMIGASRTIVEKSLNAPMLNSMCASGSTSTSRRLAWPAEAAFHYVYLTRGIKQNPLKYRNPLKYFQRRGRAPTLSRRTRLVAFLC
jgi:hypothetical protein